MPPKQDKNINKSDKSDIKTSDTKKNGKPNDLTRHVSATGSTKVGTGHLSNTDEALRQSTQSQGRVKGPNMTGPEGRDDNMGKEPSIMDKESKLKDTESYIEGKDPKQYQGKFPSTLTLR